MAKQEFHIRNRLLHKPVFNTPDGKAHFAVSPLPDAQNADFTLTTIRSEGQYNSIIYEEKDSYRGTSHRWSILMNRDDMAKMGLTAKSQATITSPHGQMQAVTVYPFDLPGGAVMAYYPEANVLADISTDPRSKTPAYKSIPVSIRPA